MVGLVEIPGPPSPSLGYSISHQRVELDIDLLSRSLKGKTEITINPHSRDLKSVRLNCRQCQLKRLSINGRPATSMSYDEPYNNSKLRWHAGVHQHHMLRQRIEGQLQFPPEEELVVNLPRNMRIDELDPFSIEAQSPLLARPDGTKRDSGDVSVLDLAQGAKTAVEQTARFTPVVIYVEFIIEQIRDGMQFVGWEDGDLRYPHAYTQRSSPNTACCLFPCLDNISSRCTWEISIKCPKTIGDVFQERRPSEHASVNGFTNGSNEHRTSTGEKDAISSFSDEEKALDLVVICSGEMTDEVVLKVRHVSIR